MALVLLSAGPSCVAAGHLDEDDLLAAHVSGEFRADAPGGVVLLARGAEPILLAAYGLADVERGMPMRVDQSLPIGSITKSFTAGAILRLAAAGELALDDDVRAYVPEAPVGGRVVTLEQLLTHTSGIPSLVDVPGFSEWAQEVRTTAELLARTEGVPFSFEPGSSFSYSDTGYILLGAVLEELRGRSWEEVVHDLVAEPLGLDGVRPAGAVAAPAMGYEVDGTDVRPVDGIDWSVPHASGALAATVLDLLRWVRAWRDDSFLPADLREAAWHARVLPDGSRSGYGFGWKRCDFEGHQAVQHGGWVPGYTAGILHLIDEDLTAVCLANADGTVEASYVARRAMRLLVTGRAEPATIVLTRAERVRLCGRYRTDAGDSWTIKDGGAGLTLDMGWGPIDLVAHSPLVLSAADSDGTWCFTLRPGEPDLLEMSLTCEPRGRAWRVESFPPGSRIPARERSGVPAGLRPLLVGSGARRGGRFVVAPVGHLWRGPAEAARP